MGKHARRLARAGFLFLDDIGKGKLTDAVQAHLHDVLEERTANLLPTLWTSNAGGAELAAMFRRGSRRAVFAAGSPRRSFPPSFACERLEPADRRTKHQAGRRR